MEDGAGNVVGRGEEKRQRQRGREGREEDERGSRAEGRRSRDVNGGDAREEEGRRRRRQAGEEERMRGAEGQREAGGVDYDLPHRARSSSCPSRGQSLLPPPNSQPSLPPSTYRSLLSMQVVAAASHARPISRSRCFACRAQAQQGRRGEGCRRAMRALPPPLPRLCTVGRTPLQEAPSSCVPMARMSIHPSAWRTRGRRCKGGRRPRWWD